MKTLICIRHAKSSWANPGMSDYDRPLNERGEKDAPMMAERLLKRNIKLDLLVSSPAKRARTTCRSFAKAYNLEKDGIQFKEDLYLALPEVFFKIISGIDDEVKHIAVFAHNPGITDFVNRLTNYRIDNMPTCAVFAVKINTDKWSSFETAEKEFWFFDYPKNEKEKR
jgi:phosphohistidine phosphatase